MPRKKIVTAELLAELIDKARRVKKLQMGRIEIGRRSDGQPIYHYPRITKALLAEKLGVSANYLTILQGRDSEIRDAMKHVGQPRGPIATVEGEEPRINTKAWLELKVKRQGEKIEKLEKKIEKFRGRNVAIKSAEMQIEELLKNHDELLKRLFMQKQEIVRLESVEKGLRMENASLKTRLALREE